MFDGDITVSKERHGNLIDLQDIDETALQTDETVVDEHADGHSRNGLTHGIGHMPDTGRIRRKTAFVDHMTVFYDHQLMHVNIFLIHQRLHKSGNILGGKALLFGGAAGKWLLDGILRHKLTLFQCLLIVGKRGLLGLIGNLSEASRFPVDDLPKQLYKRNIAACHDYSLHICVLT